MIVEELAGDGPAPRPMPIPEPMSTQHIQVTPDNVVALAKMFNDCAERLGNELRYVSDDLRLKEPWLGDPASRWAQHRFNEYFVDGEHAFAKVLQNEYYQHFAMTEALIATARHYGKTDELVAAGIIQAGPPK
jgi:hypothetical protein